MVEFLSNYGLFAAKRGLATGVWFRQNLGLQYDAVIFLVGFVRYSHVYLHGYYALLYQ